MRVRRRRTGSRRAFVRGGTLLLAGFALLAPAVRAQSPPPNDLLAGAARVRTTSFVDAAVPFVSALFDTDDVAPALGDADCGGGALDGVWYTFTPVTAGDVTVTIGTPAPYATILLYTAAGEGAATADALTPLSGCAVRSTLTLSDAAAGQVYYAFVGNRDRFGVGQPSDVFFTGTAVLPVALTSFDAAADGDAVRLRWETASETNNAGFHVEVRVAACAAQPEEEGPCPSPLRASPGPSQWDAVAFVPGGGTTAAVQRYAYRVAGLSPGVHRFRLKQVDFDGAFAYSPEVEVQVGVPGAYVLSPVYPNPFGAAQAHFTLAVRQTQRVWVVVYDLLGREVVRLYDGLLEADTAHRFALDGAGLTSGVYLVRAVGEHFAAVQQATLTR